MTTVIEMEHIIDCTPEVFWEEIHKSLEFMEFLYHDNLGHGYESLLADWDNGRGVCRITPKVAMPAVLQKALGADFSFEEHGQIEGDTYRFKINPATFKDRIFTTGVMQILPVDGGRCNRKVAIEITVKAAGIGGIAERFVDKTTRSDYDVSARLTNEYLEKKGLRAG